MGCKVRREEEWRRQSPVVVILNSVPGLGNEQNHWRMHSHSRLTNRPFSNLGLSSNTNPNEWSIRPPTERIQPWYMALDWSTRLHNLILYASLQSMAFLWILHKDIFFFHLALCLNTEDYDFDVRWSADIIVDEESWMAALLVCMEENDLLWIWWRYVSWECTAEPYRNWALLLSYITLDVACWKLEVVRYITDNKDRSRCDDSKVGWWVHW